MQHPSIDARLVEIAARSFGAASGRDIRLQGISHDALHRRVRAGTIRRILPDTYLVGPQSIHPDHDTLCAAAVLAGGPDAHLSGETAAQRHEMWDRGTSTIHVTASLHRPSRQDLGIVYHRTTGVSASVLPVKDITALAPIPTCRELGRTLTPHQVAWCIGRARFLQLFTIEQLEDELTQHKGGRGVGTVRRALDLWTSGSRGTSSPGEDTFLAMTQHLPVPAPIVNTRGAAGIAGAEPDFVWPHAMLIVEVDGRQHLEPHHAEMDRIRDEQHAELGWHTLRTRAIRLWREPARVRREFMRVVTSRARSLGNRQSHRALDG